MRKKITIIALLLVAGVLVTVVLATPITPAYLTARLGSFTGPEGGTAQDDNVKASLDLAHTDLDTGLQLDQDSLGLLGMGPGNIFYVDSDTDGTAGTSWATAVGTIDEAVNLCTTGAGDIILVAPGHSEELTAADGVDVDKTAITIVGLGSGASIPLLDYTNANGEFVIGADNVRIINLRFHANVTTVTKAIDIEAGAKNAVIENCIFDVETAGTDEFNNAIIIGDASDDPQIIGCKFYQGAAAAVSAIYLDHDADRARIIGNEIYGDYSTACIVSDTAASEDILIKDNVLFNGTTGGDTGLNTEPCIELLATTTGMIIDNRISCNVANPELSIVAADCYLFNNIYNENEGNSSGQIIGTRAGERYVSIKTGATAASDDLFDVDGGPILIECFIGLVTTNIENKANTCEIVLDADTGYTDYDFTTAVDLDNDQAGQRIVFSSANESVLTPLAGADGGATTLMTPWFCGEGMIESNHSDTSTGAITYYMIWTPLVDGVTVTVQ